MKRIAIVLVIAAICVISARGQSFQNLDFESAYGLPANPGSGVMLPVANALPDWTAYYGRPSNDEPLSSITYASNSAPLGAVTVVALEGGSLALSGDFSVYLAEFGSISQTGLVPENAGSLQFEAGPDLNSYPFYVYLGGQGLSFSPISEGPNYTTVYGATISAGMDGQMEMLTFGIDNADTPLDNIEFLPVPEPSEYALIGPGAVMLGLWWRRKRCVNGSD